MELILIIILLAFIFETLDSAAGMGFGTGMAPLLLSMGYSSLQVVPALLISEAITGIMDGVFDHEFKNVQFSFRPLNETTKVTLHIAFFGCLATFISVFLSHYVIAFPEEVIKIYVAALVVFMGIFGLLRLKLKNIKKYKYKPKMLFAFSALAGFNKGIGGGGYGPVVTLGEIFSGIYEKSATAIVSFAEGLVSITGIIVFFGISFAGVNVDLILLPSIFTGGFFAAILAPYLVRVLPNKIWKYLIPVYAFGIGIFLILKIFVL
ncbi:MAG: TSUP family transporter [Candidatus Hodarchaeota archaeon]